MRSFALALLFCSTTLGYISKSPLSLISKRSKISLYSCPSSIKENALKNAKFITSASFLTASLIIQKSPNNIASAEELIDETKYTTTQRSDKRNTYYNKNDYNINRCNFNIKSSGLKYYDIKEGDGAIPVPGDVVRVHYTGWLDGFESEKKFDSSYDRRRLIYTIT
jgi:FKBP-type peptidyl-prolyl cis-trans isomerase